MPCRFVQKEVLDLRLALSIGRKNEEELAKKNLACEKTVDSLVSCIKGGSKQQVRGKARRDTTLRLCADKSGP